jgi:hypothetical protein
MQSQKHVHILTCTPDKVGYVSESLIPKLLHKPIQSIVVSCNQTICIREKIFLESLPYDNSIRFIMCGVQ